MYKYEGHSKIIKMFKAPTMHDITALHLSYFTFLLGIFLNFCLFPSLELAICDFFLFIAVKKFRGTAFVPP